MVAARPPLTRWVLYAVGFRLPERFDEWVFHDLNDRGWQLREVARVMPLTVPLVIGVMFVPGRLSLRLSTASASSFSDRSSSAPPTWTSSVPTGCASTACCRRQARAPTEQGPRVLVTPAV